MRRLSRFRPPLPLAIFLILTAGIVPAAQAPFEPSLATHWRPRGSGHAARATWQSIGGDPSITISCDRDAARIRVRIASSALPPRIEQLRLSADGVAMDYPADASRIGGLNTVTARIALDAPILDRMLVARTFDIGVGGHALRTGLPGEALARVVRACRELHWPREAASLRPARIDPSEAGFAK